MITFLVLTAVVWLVGYSISLRLHPYTACPTCRGRGRHYGMVFRSNWRPCHACDGKGRRQRWGARWLGLGMPRFGRPTGRRAPRTIEWPVDGRNP
jgi:hypothetical protein